MTALTSRTLAALSLILLAISAGCSQTPVADKPSTDKEASAKDSAANNAPAADPMTQELTADSTASEVCQRFMLLLQDGKRLEAEALLSRRANKTITEVGLELDLGDGNSKITVSDATYATSLAKVAQVTSHVGTAAQKQDFTWMLRNTKSGWRITGLIVKGEDGPDLRSLESRADVAAMQRSMGAPTETDPNIRQVSAQKDVSDN